MALQVYIFLWMLAVIITAYKFEKFALLSIIILIASYLKSLFLRKIKIQNNLCSIILLIFIECHFTLYVILSAWHIFPYNAQKHSKLDNLLLIGQLLIILHILICLFFNKRYSHNKVPKYRYREWVSVWLKGSFFLFIFFSLLMSFIAYWYNIGQMGIKEPSLPFKIPNIMIQYKATVVPFLALLFIDYFQIKKEKRYVFISLTFLFIFALLESYMRGSRGVFFNIGLSLILWWVVVSHITWKGFVTFGIIFVFTSTLSFYLFTTVRFMRLNKKKMTVASVIDETNFYNPFNNELIYNRVFGTGSEIIEFIPYMQNKWLGISWKDYSEFKGGGIGFHTYVIDKHPRGEAHSSGITGLADGFLFAGYPGLFITMVLFSILSVLIDQGKLSLITRTSVGKSQVIFLLINIFFSGIGSWSLLLFRHPMFHVLWISLFLFQYLSVEDSQNV